MQNCTFISVVNEIKTSLSLNCVVLNCDLFPGAALTICKRCSTLEFVANVARLQVILLACALPSITVNCASIFCKHTMAARFAELSDDDTDLLAPNKSTICSTSSNNC